jgi:diguanylate cyclase (GGDEF)-like protein
LKTYLRIFMIGCILSALISPRAISTAAPLAKKNVLVLLPYQAGMPYNQTTIQAIQDEFTRAGDISVDMYVEYLDINRFPEESYQQELMLFLKAKYNAKPPDLVIFGNGIMLSRWRKRPEGFAAQTPVVFYSVSADELPEVSKIPNITGVITNIDYTQVLRWYLKNKPETNEVVLVHGVGKSDQVYTQYIDQLRADIGGRIKYTDLSILPLAEIKERLAKLPPTSVVVYNVMFEDAAGNHYTPIEVMRQIASASAVPILSGYEQFLDAGSMGGYMFSLELEGQKVAQLGLRILRGEPASSIPIDTNSSKHFAFDHPTLQRFGISLSALPPDSYIARRQYTLWETYRTEVTVVSAAFGALLLALLVVLGITRKLNRTRLALAELNANLEGQVHERTQALVQTNTLLQDEIVERRHLEGELKRLATQDELTGLINRRYFIELAQNEIQRSHQLHHPLAVAFIDLDHFKEINDTYGHFSGDQILRVFVRLCHKQIRKIDVFARLGGDEFMLLLPEMTLAQAVETVERFRAAVTAAPLTLDHRSIRITISSGVAELAGERDTLEQLLERADHALYQAKQNGRNCVVQTSERETPDSRLHFRSFLSN